MKTSYPKEGHSDLFYRDMVYRDNELLLCTESNSSSNFIMQDTKVVVVKARGLREGSVLCEHVHGEHV